MLLLDLVPETSIFIDEKSSDDKLFIVPSINYIFRFAACPEIPLNEIVPCANFV